MSEANSWKEIWKGSERMRFYNTSGKPEWNYIATVINKFLNIKEGYLVLEAGCGSAKYSAILAKRGGLIVGLDISKDALEVAREVFNNQSLIDNVVGFVVGDIKNLPFKSDIFKVVFNEGVVEHFVGRDRQKVIDEMARVSAFEGDVLILVPNRLNIATRIEYFFTMKIRRQKWPFGLEIPYSSMELKKRMLKSGLKITKCGGISAVFSILDIFLLFIMLFIKSNYRKERFLKMRYKLSNKLLFLNAGDDVVNRYLGRQIFCVGHKKGLKSQRRE